MRGPVGSLARPENIEAFEALDAGEGVVVFLECALMTRASSAPITFQFGLLGRCSVSIAP